MRISRLEALLQVAHDDLATLAGAIGPPRLKRWH
jgi:hypothetical protein